MGICIAADTLIRKPKDKKDKMEIIRIALKYEDRGYDKSYYDAIEKFYLPIDPPFNVIKKVKCLSEANVCGAVQGEGGYLEIFDKQGINSARPFKRVDGDNLPRETFCDKFAASMKIVEDEIIKLFLGEKDQPQIEKFIQRGGLGNVILVDQNDESNVPKAYLIRPNYNLQAISSHEVIKRPRLDGPSEQSPPPPDDIVSFNYILTPLDRPKTFGVAKDYAKIGCKAYCLGRDGQATSSTLVDKFLMDLFRDIKKQDQRFVNDLPWGILVRLDGPVPLPDWYVFLYRLIKRCYDRLIMKMRLHGRIDIL